MHKMADVFMLAESVWIFLLIIEIIDADIQFATPANLVLGKVWYARKGFSLTIPCVTEEKPGDKYKGAMYNWRDTMDVGKGMVGFRRTIYGNGTMTMVDLQTTDSGRIECVVSRIETADKFTFAHTVVVYYVAEFSMINPFFYTVPNCDEVLTVNKLHDLLEFACDEYRNRSVVCPFSARKDCSKKTPLEVSEGSDGEYRLQIIIEQQPEKDFTVPDCSLKCMKKSIIGHLQQYGDDLLRRLAKREDQVQSNLFKGFVFEKGELLNRRIRTTCFGGFELFQYIICMPCFPGSYIAYTYQFDETQTVSSHCQPCDYGSYQESFALDECHRCPSMGTTMTNGTADARSCTTHSWNIAYAYYGIGGILAVAVVATCLGMFVVISSQKKKEKEAIQKMEEDQRSSAMSEASSSAEALTIVPPPLRSSFALQRPSNNASINVNVNRRFSGGAIVVGRRKSSPLPTRPRGEDAPHPPDSPSSSHSSNNSRRPMLHGSSPAIMQNTMASRLL